MAEQVIKMSGVKGMKWGSTKGKAEKKSIIKQTKKEWAFDPKVGKVREKPFTDYDPKTNKWKVRK
jgi:hypothetical protein